MAKKKTFNNPDSQEREYTRILLRYSRQLQADVNTVLIPRIGDIALQFKTETRSDSWVDTLDDLIAELGRLAVSALATVVTKLPGQYAAVSKFNEGQFKMVVKANTGLPLPPVMPGAPSSAILGVNVFRSEPFLKPLAEGWVSNNTSLIKSLPTRLHPELEGIVRRGVMNGQSVKDIQDQLKARYGVTDYRAKLIAQDQVLKANADLTRYRLQSVGVKRYTWRSVQDNRVRPEHAYLNGKEFDFDTPPAEGHPGQPVRCRCRAEAIWDDKEGAVETPTLAEATLAPGEWGTAPEYIKTQSRLYSEGFTHFEKYPDQGRAIREYQRTGRNSSRVINGGLNGIVPMSNATAKAVTVLDEAVSVSRIDEILYRGSDHLGDIKLPQDFKEAKRLIGMVGTEKGFVSTSISPRSGFMRTVGIEINGPKRGVHVFSARDSQKVKSVIKKGELLSEGSEVLLGRNTSYRIIGVDQRPHPNIKDRIMTVYRVETL